MAEETKSEKALYNSIEDLMVSRGYAVIREFKAFFPLADRNALAGPVGLPVG